MRIKTPVLVTIASSPHPSHERVALPPARPSRAHVLVPIGRPGVPAPFALRGASTIAWGSGWSVGARNPSGSARGNHTQGTAVSPSKRREPASFPATRPDSVACAPIRMPSLRDRCPIVHRGSREPLSPHDAACLVFTSFHRFAPLLPLIGSFRAYRRRAIAAINGLASYPPNPRSGHLLDGAGSPQLRPAHSFKPARN